MSDNLSSMDEMFRPFDRLREIKSELSEIAAREKTLRHELQSVDRECVEMLQRGGMQRINRNGVTFAQQRQFFARMKPEVPRDVIIGTLNRSGHAEFLQLSSNAVRAKLREAEESGKTLDPILLDLIDCGWETRISVTGLKGQSETSQEADKFF